MAVGLNLPKDKDLPVVFAAKVLATLHNSNPIYATLYLLDDVQGLPRAQLAVVALNHVSSMLHTNAPGSTANPFPAGSDNLKRMTITPLRDVHASRNNPPNPVHYLLTVDAALWTHTIKLSSHVKKENEKALAAIAQDKANNSGQPKKRSKPQVRAKSSSGKPPAQKATEVKKTGKIGKEGQKTQKRPASAKPKKVKA
jgi:hypothetical protein